MLRRTRIETNKMKYCDYTQFTAYFFMSLSSLSLSCRVDEDFSVSLSTLCSLTDSESKRSRVQVIIETHIGGKNDQVYLMKLEPKNKLIDYPLQSVYADEPLCRILNSLVVIKKIITPLTRERECCRIKQFSLISTETMDY